MQTNHLEFRASKADDIWHRLSPNVLLDTAAEKALYRIAGQEDGKLPAAQFSGPEGLLEQRARAVRKTTAAPPAICVVGYASFGDGAIAFIFTLLLILESL